MAWKLRLLAALVAALSALSACGDDDESEETTVAQTDLERYCEIAGELDAAGHEEFEALEKDPKATQEDFEAAERKLVEENEDLLDEVAEVAPEQIQGDVEVLVEALRARAGLGDDGPSSREERKAELAVNSFEDENCPSGEPLAP